MITFSNLGTKGRLGNQLFQYAALKSLGIHNDYEVKIPDPKNKNWHGQECLLGDFNLQCSYLDNNDLSKIKYRYEERNDEFHYIFDNNFFSLPDNIDIDGFFQNTKYFEKYRNQIIKELTPNDIHIDKSNEIIKKIKENNNGYEIVSLHVRRGDNTDGTNKASPVSEMFGTNNNFDNNSVYGKYLNKAKKIFINKKVKFLIFSGGSRNCNNNLSDIDWCKKNLSSEEYVYLEDTYDTITDFSLISLCDHNINCHSTTFGWWASYINQNVEKIVISPKSYSIPDDGRYLSGFYPKNWIII